MRTSDKPLTPSGTQLTGNTLRAVVIDIECAPILAYTWSLFKPIIPPGMIVRDWFITSVAWQEVGTKKVNYKDLRYCRDGEGAYDDSDLLQTLHGILDEFDVIIGQNSRSFDVPKINYILMKAGLNPPSPYRHIDTMRAARAVAATTSSKLEWLGKVFTSRRKSAHGKFPGNSLIREMLDGNIDAWKENEAYNKQDVVVTMELYMRLRPWIKDHAPLVPLSEKMTCPRCGSKKLRDFGVFHDRVHKRAKIQCVGCGGWLSKLKNGEMRCA